MAFTARLGSVMGKPVRLVVGVWLACLLVTALLAACSDEPEETPTPQTDSATSTPGLAAVPPTASSPLVPGTHGYASPGYRGRYRI